MALLLAVVARDTVKRRVPRLRRGAPRWRVYGPLALVAAAVPLVLADPLRHVLQDTGVWPACIATASGACSIWSRCVWQ
jgi:hypothetical protein